MVNFALNLLWLVCGGLLAALGWYLAGILCILTIVGIPWARACFMLGAFTFWPFGQQMVDRRDLTGYEDVGTGPFGMLGNILWFVIAGIWLAVGHLTLAFGCAITIIGIPFAVQHVKLAEACLFPIGKTVIPSGDGVITRRVEAALHELKQSF